MKKVRLAGLYFGIVMALAVAGLMSLHPKSVSAFDEQEFRIPISRNGVPAQNLLFAGTELGVTSMTTTAKVIYTGKGILSGVEISTGPSSAWVVCSDSATANTELNDGTANRLLFSPLFIPDPTIASGIMVNNQTGFSPKEFDNGLNCWMSSDQIRANYAYRPVNR